MSKGHAVAVLLVTPNGIPLVRDFNKPSPIFWRLPGGRSEATETAESCAVRKLEKKLGVSLSESDLTVVHSEDRGSHVLTIFRADLAVLPQMKLEGDGYEEIGVFLPRDILTKDDFFPNHRKVVGSILMTLP